MKTKIFAIISFLLIFCFVSCSNVLEEKEEISSGTATVSFNFGNERAIVSTAEPENYFYTLKGTYANETKTLCEKMSYTDFLAKSFYISQGDWAFGLLELSLAPHWMFTASDMWNCGETNLHYYQGLVTYNTGSHRIQAGYGRTRAGYNCSGGVCRYVPAQKGFTVSYNYNF